MESGRDGRDVRGKGREGFVVPPFDPFEPPRHGLTFNFANFFSPVRITRGTTLRPRRKGWLLLSRVTLTFSFFSKARGRSSGTRVRGGWRMGPACLHENDGRKNNYSLHTARRILGACFRMSGDRKKGSSDSLKLLPRSSIFSRYHCNLNNNIFSLLSFWIY